MPESQSHGFQWENEIKTTVFDIREHIPYTAAHDIPKEHNKFNNRENVSIKTTGSSTACMGCPLRIYDYDRDEQHTSIIVLFKQEGDTKRVTNVYELDLDDRVALWGSVTREDIQELTNLVCSMPHGKERDPAITTAINKKKKELNAKSGAMRFNAKIDSKTQRRLQCSIPKFAQCSAVKSAVVGAVVRDVEINGVLQSPPRARNARV